MDSEQYAPGFPAFFYHATKGARLFQDPTQLAQAGKGWEDSPAAHGLTAEALPVSEPGGMMFRRAIDQPEDGIGDRTGMIFDEPATETEVIESAAKAAKRASTASIPSSKASRAAVTGRRK